MRYTRKLKRGGGIFDFFKRIFTRKAKVAPLLKEPSMQEREHENIFTADVQGLKIPYESFREGIERSFVFAYYKYKNMPLDYSVKKLRSEEKKELQDAVNAYGDDTDSIVRDVFHMNSIDDFNIELANWEYAKSLGGILNKSTNPKKAESYSKGLERLLPHIKRTDRELDYHSDIDKFQCPDPSKWGNIEAKDNICFYVCPSFNNFFTKFMEETPSEAQGYYIVLNKYDIPSKHIRARSISNISFIKDAFVQRDVCLVHPRLGWLIQKNVPNLWNQTYWIQPNKRSIFSSTMDDIDRIVILTLQKYTVFRRYLATGDSDWCPDVYSHNPKEIYMAHELKNPQYLAHIYNFNEAEFLEELIENQNWAGKVKYNTLQDLNRLLPTPRGFNPPLPWEILDSKNKNVPKLNERHANILRSLANTRSMRVRQTPRGPIRTRVRNQETTAILKQANAWEMVERLKHRPQYITTNSLQRYQRNYGH